MTSDVIDLLDALVRIDSANPGLSDGAPGESEIAAYVADWATAPACGSRSSSRRLAGRASWSVAGTPPAGEPLMLCGHLDTVGLAGMDATPRSAHRAATASTPAAPTT